MCAPFVTSYPLAHDKGFRRGLPETFGVIVAVRMNVHRTLASLAPMLHCQSNLLWRKSMDNGFCVMTCTTPDNNLRTLYRIHGVIVSGREKKVKPYIVGVRPGANSVGALAALTLCVHFRIELLQISDKHPQRGDVVVLNRLDEMVSASLSRIPFQIEVQIFLDGVHVLIVQGSR